jgi:hypothetical protein
MLSWIENGPCHPFDIYPRHEVFVIYLTSLRSECLVKLQGALMECIGAVYATLKEVFIPRS